MKLLLLINVLAVASVSSGKIEYFPQPGFPQGRVINGKDAAKGEAPYIVSIRGTSHFCGGSIIDKHWILTAGHCLIYQNYQVVAGLHKRSNESDVQIRTVSGRDYQFVHEDFSGDVGPHDIGLIYFEKPFDLNALARDGSAPVAKINLPSGKYEQTGRGKLYGWGRDNSNLLTDTLQTLDVDIIDYKECKDALPKSAPLDPKNICSYTAGKTDGVCLGDSGGPLIRNTPAGAEIVGIVSWGYAPCATMKYPSVYTRVSAYKAWIYRTIHNFYNST